VARNLRHKFECKAAEFSGINSHSRSDLGVHSLSIMKRLRHFLITLLQSGLLVALPQLGYAEDFGFKLDLTQKPTGSFFVSGVMNGTETVDLLVDTGADMIILSAKSFRSLRKTQGLEPVKRMAARMADGRSKSVEVYHIESLLLGKNCNVGPVEVAVIPGAANNILGLNVLNKAAPFALYNAPPTLALSVCGLMDPPVHG